MGWGAAGAEGVERDEAASGLWLLPDSSDEPRDLGTLPFPHPP